jgi:hypothetical protein
MFQTARNLFNALAVENGRERISIKTERTGCATHAQKKEGNASKEGINMDIQSISALYAAKSRDLLQGSLMIKVTYAISTTRLRSNAKK